MGGHWRGREPQLRDSSHDSPSPPNTNPMTRSRFRGLSGTCARTTRWPAVHVLFWKVTFGQACCISSNRGAHTRVCRVETFSTLGFEFHYRRTSVETSLDTARKSACATREITNSEAGERCGLAVCLLQTPDPCSW